MTSINSQEDFLRTLSENPQWKAAVRAQILGEELLQLPARFDAFVEQMTGFIAEMKAFVAEMKAFVARQEQHNAEMTRFVAEQKEINASIAGHLSRLDNDTGWLKGYFTREEAVREAPMIAMDMGLEYIRTIPRADLFRMALEAAQGKALSNELKSFRRADIVIEATDGENTQCIAVEVSFTGGARDTNRALRNANLLTEFTGLPARAAVASIRNHDSINWQIASGAIHWHEMEELYPELE